MANGGVTTEQRMQRRKAVAAELATLTRKSGRAIELAEEFGCSESVIWADRKWLLKQAADAHGDLTPAEIGAEFLARLRDAQEDARIDGAHGPRMAGLGLEAKVLGVLAPEKTEVTVSAAPASALSQDEWAWVAHMRARWDELVAKREAGTLTDMERSALDVFGHGWSE